ncbi:helix-turn-helix domain-containing protein [Acrocarpospora catenulata]|uniref:helix-turn-helix domain-containing protein n=1 Tax=Acrocarpospora catenulata TaxID=2836182 RepID=UPI001BD96BED|nr:helix-turn-helix transcriptional regulator [Acrocarpospora catenulata]
MPAPHELDPTRSPRALLGAELRKYRKLAKLSQEELAEKINFSAGMISFTERAARMPSRELIELCEKALGLDGELLRLWPLVTMEAAPQWFQHWIEIEPDAVTLRTWEPLLVPGLLQTEDYARALLTRTRGMTEQQVEEAVTARMTRQRIFDREVPPMFWVVIDEGVLCRPLGDKEMMRRQLEHLIEMADRPLVTIQVVPLNSCAAAGLLGGFVIAQLSGQPDTVYIESVAQGYVTSKHEEVMPVVIAYEVIRADALSVSASLELIKEKMETLWT